MVENNDNSILIKEIKVSQNANSQALKYRYSLIEKRQEDYFYKGNKRTNTFYKVNLDADKLGTSSKSKSEDSSQSQSFSDNSSIQRKSVNSQDLTYFEIKEVDQSSVEVQIDLPWS